MSVLSPTTQSTVTSPHATPNNNNDNNNRSSSSPLTPTSPLPSSSSPAKFQVPPSPLTTTSSSPLSSKQPPPSAIASSKPKPRGQVRSVSPFSRPLCAPSQQRRGSSTSPAVRKQPRPSNERTVVVAPIEEGQVSGPVAYTHRGHSFVRVSAVCTPNVKHASAAASDNLTMLPANAPPPPPPSVVAPSFATLSQMPIKAYYSLLPPPSPLHLSSSSPRSPSSATATMAPLSPGHVRIHTHMDTSLEAQDLRAAKRPPEGTSPKSTPQQQQQRRNSVFSSRTPRFFPLLDTTGLDAPPVGHYKPRNFMLRLGKGTSEETTAQEGAEGSNQRRMFVLAAPLVADADESHIVATSRRPSVISTRRSSFEETPQPALSQDISAHAA